MLDILYKLNLSSQILNKYSLIFYFFFAIQIFLSCGRDKIFPLDDEPIKQHCPEMYEARSQAYINPYMGTLNNGSVFPPSAKFPEQFSYVNPCINPNNDFEFCFSRRDNATQGFNDMDLFTYNFCTGQSKKIASHVNIWNDWGSQDWIIFTGSDGNLWKIKSNSDSLTQLTDKGEIYSAKWSPDGNSFICNGLKWYDKQGALIKSFSTGPSFFVWKDNETIIEGKPVDNDNYFEIFEHNIVHGSRFSLTKVPATGSMSVNFLSGNLLYFIVGDPLNTSSQLYYTLNITTRDTTRLYSLPFSFTQSIAKSPTGKLLLRQSLIDTMTGNPLYLNYRYHIAIMDLDGKNERQVIIPE